jgi:hypothetical protein
VPGGETLPDSPFIKFRQLLQLRLDHVEYGKILKPDRWDGGDPHEELPRIFINRELFAAFVDTRRLEGILLDPNEMDNNQLREQLPHLIRRARRRNLSQETKLIFRNIALVSEVMMDVVTKYRDVYRPLFLQEAEAEQSGVASILATERRALVDKYIDEVYDRTGKRITRTEIWRKAGYSTRTEFERWQRQDPKATPTAHEKFMRLLQKERPHLK